LNNALENGIKIIPSQDFKIDLFNDNFLRCSIDCSRSFGKSKLEKSILIATSAGTIPLGDSNVFFNLICCYNSRKKINFDGLKALTISTKKEFIKSENTDFHIIKRDSHN